MKMVIAVTDIKYNDLRIKSGEPIPVDQFDKDTLLKLYEIGSIDKVEMDEEEASGLTPDDLKDAGTNVAAPKAEVEEPETPEAPEAPAETPETPETPAETKTEVAPEAPVEAPSAPTTTTTTTTSKTSTAKSSGGTK